jgi:hypothetical protein
LGEGVKIGWFPGNLISNTPTLPLSYPTARIELSSLWKSIVNTALSTLIILSGKEGFFNEKIAMTLVLDYLPNSYYP